MVVMQAMVITGHGGLEVFRQMEVPQPDLREFDLLVKVHATSVNPADCRARIGSKIPRQFPLILGYDVSGTVVAIGDALQEPRCVASFQVGDQVYAMPNVLRQGANAEYVAIDSRSAALKPQTLDHSTAAVLPLVSLTAWECLHRRAQVQPGQTVLIHAGAGGVGHIAIQLAKLHGCHVITTAGRAESIQFCQHTLQADAVIDYKTTDWVEQVLDLTQGQGCPVILDFVGGDVFERSMDCIAVEGQLVTIVPTASDRIAEKLFLKNVTLHYEFAGAPTAYNRNPERQGEILSTLRDLIDRGLVKPHISHKLSLTDVPEGHRLQETGHVMGKIAIVVNP
ncbi:MAG TPA: zinc-binding dehydrogenase [Coleofasciculaceae cyanobacterium]